MTLSAIGSLNKNGAKHVGHIRSEIPTGKRDGGHRDPNPMGRRTRGEARKTGPKTLSGFVGRKKDRNDFLYIRNQYIAAREIYLAEADRLCHMLSACDGDALNVADHVALIAQRHQENDAHDEYIRARKRLLRSARLTSTSKSFQRISR